MEKNHRMEGILDKCIERLRKGETVEAILKDYPEESNLLKSQLGMAKSLFQLKHPEPDMSAVHRTIFKIGSEHGFQGVKRERDCGFRTVLAWAASIILIIMTGTYAAANFADSSIPGDLLYPVKLASEKVRLALVRTPHGEVEMRIALSERRMQEVIVSTEQGNLHEAVLGAMLDEAGKAVNNIKKLKGMKRTLMLQRVKSLCASHQDVLKELITITPVEDHDQIQQAIVTSEECWIKCCEMDPMKPQKCLE